MKIVIAINDGVPRIGAAHLIRAVSEMVRGGDKPEDGSEIPLLMWRGGEATTVGSAFIIAGKGGV